MYSEHYLFLGGVKVTRPSAVISEVFNLDGSTPRAGNGWGLACKIEGLHHYAMDRVELWSSNAMGWGQIDYEGRLPSGGEISELICISLYIGYVVLYKLESDSGSLICLATDSGKYFPIRRSGVSDCFLSTPSRGWKNSVNISYIFTLRWAIH